MTAPTIEHSLQQIFGFDALRQGQQEVIDTVMSGHSCAAIFPTGSGKSLCYQLPALHLPHLTLVISPLLALIKDQVDFLQGKGIAAASIDSSMDRDAVQQVMQGVRDGSIKILMISVERLKNERFRHFISQIPLSMMVVDEAHCISEWGHNFRPDYLKLPQYMQQLNIPQVLLLTATATPSVIEDMKSKFAIAPEHIVVTGFYRPNLNLMIKPCDNDDKLDALYNHLQESESKPSIIYVTLQQTAEQVARQLQKLDVNAHAYHAGLASEVREAIQRQFMLGEINCIVATIAFGMGVDKADIRQVIHFDLPKSIENYSQEIGRAGRDRNESDCILLGNKTGLTVLENFVYGDTPDEAAIAGVLQLIDQQDGDWEFTLNYLSREYNIRQLPLKTLLVYLELKNVISPKFSYFADYRFKLIKTKHEILAHFQGERQAFVEAIFQCAPKARVWHQLDFDALYQYHNAPRQRVVAAIDYFNEQGWIELESKQITEVYQVIDTSQPVSQLALELYNLFEQKEASEIGRIRNMVELFESDQCLSHQLARYFADEKAPEKCGHCSVCTGQVAKLPGSHHEHHLAAIEQIQQWIAPFLQACPSSVTDQSVARFLCGITTPLITKTKAKKMEGFATLEHLPFADVVQAIVQARA